MKQILYFMVLISFNNYAQNLNILLENLKNAKEDTSRILLLNKLGNYYKTNKFDSALFYFEKSKKLSEKINYSAGLENYYINIHGIYINKGQYDSSVAIIRKALKLVEKGGNQKRLALCYENLSTSYHHLLKFDSCSKYDQKALAILEKLNDKTELVSMYGNLCGFYNEQHQFEKSKEYGLKAVALKKQGYGNDDAFTHVLNNLSTTYIYLNQYDNAILYGKQCIALCKKTKNYSILQVIIGNMLIVYIGQKRYKEMLPLTDELKALGGVINTPIYHASLNFDYSMSHYFNGNNKEAKEYALKALAISVPNKYSVVTKNSYNVLEKVEAINGNYFDSEMYSDKKDSISYDQVNIEMSKSIKDFEKKYETQKKDNEILKLNTSNAQKSNLNKLLIGLSIALLTFAFFIYRNYQNRQKIAKQTQEIQQQKITELEKDKQLMTVDAMLKGQEDERNRIAKDLHDGLGGMLSGVKISFMNMKENMIMDSENLGIFEKSISQLDNTIVELRKVAHNLMPEALVKFGLNDAINDFCTSLKANSKINIVYESMGETRKLGNTADVYIYRIIQELVTNAIKHGQPSQIFVQMTQTPAKVLLTVEDDGKGIDPHKLATSTGIGLTNIKHRVNYFKGKLDFESKQPSGTVVNIELFT